MATKTIAPIRIMIQDDIPDNMILEFKRLIQQDSMLLLEIETHEPIMLNATGTEISDIIIFFNEYATDLIVGGIGNIAYDLLKVGIKTLWSRLKDLPIKSITAQKTVEKNKILTFHLKQDNRDISLSLEGEFDGEILVNKAFDFLSGQNFDTIFENPDYLQHPDFIERNEKPRIRIVFNPETNIWQPKNFGEFQRNFSRDMNEFRKRMDR